MKVKTIGVDIKRTSDYSMHAIREPEKHAHDKKRQINMNVRKNVGKSNLRSTLDERCRQPVISLMVMRSTAELGTQKVDKLLVHIKGTGRENQVS